MEVEEALKEAPPARPNTHFNLIFYLIVMVDQLFCHPRINWPHKE